MLENFKNISGLKVNSSKTEGMWLGSLKGNEMKPLGIKWPSDPIKALGVFFSYDKKLLFQKNFSERLDKIKKLINIWSSRGLSLYGKVTIIKTLLLPKVVYISSLLPTPEHIVKELNYFIYNFLWKGKDKVTRVSAINNYEGGGLKMVDIESMIKSLRLSWLKRIFGDNSGVWKSYLEYLLKETGGLVLFNCNYNIKDLNINSQFYAELLKWWSEFRKDNANDTNWHYFIWNNQEIRINNKPVFYKRYFNNGIRTVRKKARFPNHAQKLKCEFNLSDEALKKAFCLPHLVAFEPYVQAFQFKVLNSILYTNSKLHKIGYISDNLCSFCKRESETIQHLFYNCSYSITFWKDFELYYLSLTKQQIHLELRDILIGVLTPECPLLNYLLLIGKIYLWGCRRNNELPNIGGYKFKVSLKYDTEKFICTKNNTLDIFKKTWTILRPI